VYNVIPGDGRELVVTDDTAVTIRAEDGRSVEGVDISPFINNLPFGKQTNDFSTPDASGSTSQASNILEALELGSKVMLIDEDTAATNFMVRDRRMMSLVAPSKEPITPYISKVRQLSRAGVSSIMVIGGCGDYFDVADLVIMQENYAASDVTAKAMELAQPLDDAGNFGEIAQRAPQSGTINAAREGDRPGQEKVSAATAHVIRFGDIDIGLESIHQIADKSQTRAIGDAILLCRDAFMDGRTPIGEVLDKLEKKMDEAGLDALQSGRYIGNYARPRRYEIGMAINRLRSIKFKQVGRKSL
jgi:predicted ABC-class ATPase